MATKISKDDIVTINQLYSTLHTYAAVARKMGISASTVKRYVIPGWTPTEHREFSGDISEFDAMCFIISDWSSLCSFSSEEEKRIIELWSELEI